MALGVSTVLYILVALSAVSVIGWRELGMSASPLADVATVIMGSKAGILLGFIALLSTSNTILLELVAMSRLIYGVSQKYLRLKFISAVNKMTNTPHNAIIVTSLLAVLFILWGNIGTL